MNTTARRESVTLALHLPVGLDPLIVEALVEALVYMVKQCFPDPTPDASASLREPSFGFFGIRRMWWRDRVKQAVAKTWKGPRELLPTVQDAVLDRLRKGVSPEVLAGLYRG